MPEICRFYGIIIQMYAREHGVPHFHARYAGESCSIGISDLMAKSGKLPDNKMRQVIQWARLHQDELRGNWERLRAGLPAHPIQPLE